MAFPSLKPEVTDTLIVNINFAAFDHSMMRPGSEQ
jgi:hypothetical protein